MGKIKKVLGALGLVGTGLIINSLYNENQELIKINRKLRDTIDHNEHDMKKLRKNLQDFDSELNQFRSFGKRRTSRKQTKVNKKRRRKSTQRRF